MTVEEAKELEIGTYLDGNGGSIEILKRISDGYIVLSYEDSHKVYHAQFYSFEDIAEYYEVVDEDTRSYYEEFIFNDSKLKHDEGWDSYFMEIED